MRIMSICRGLSFTFQMIFLVLPGVRAIQVISLSTLVPLRPLVYLYEFIIKIGSLRRDDILFHISTGMKRGLEGELESIRWQTQSLEQFNVTNA
ncbi:hypothetical protein K449DRAFT_386459 [Hypoxylon sp. EC38]|nr:hypothetical protein K449DRAFT_386459 [Hypoxylon sp. EC38]